MSTKTVLEHFVFPHADGVGNIGEPGCGDNCVIFIKVEEEKNQGNKFSDFWLLCANRMRQYDNRSGERKNSSGCIEDY